MIDGVIFTSDVIVFPDRVKSDWWRLEGHKLQLPDIQEVLQAKPAVLIVGTGAFGMMKVMPEVVEAAEAAGIRLEIERTGKACELYNELAERERRLVAALHLTC